MYKSEFQFNQNSFMKFDGEFEPYVVKNLRFQLGIVDIHIIEN